MKSKYLAAALLAASIGLGGCKGKEKSGEKDILEFWVGGVKYNISGTDITHLYPKASADTWTGWVSMPVAPSKIELSPGATIDPPTTAPQNFEAGAEYTVKAEDGSTKKYTVKAERTMNLN